MTRRLARVQGPTGRELHLDLEPRRPVRVELVVPDGPPDEAALDRLADVLAAILASPTTPQQR